MDSEYEDDFEAYSTDEEEGGSRRLWNSAGDEELKDAIKAQDLMGVRAVVRRHTQAPAACIEAVLMCRHPRLGRESPPGMRALDKNVWRVILGFARGAPLLLDYSTPCETRPYGDDEHYPQLPEQTPLMLACSLGNLPIVRFLVEEAGAQVNCLDFCGNTALCHAVEAGSGTAGTRDVIRYLVDHTEATLSIQGGMHSTPLIVACVQEDLEMVRFLCEEMGADEEECDADGNSPYEVAFECAGEDSELCEYLES